MPDSPELGRASASSLSSSSPDRLPARPSPATLLIRPHFWRSRTKLRVGVRQFARQENPADSLRSVCPVLICTSRKCAVASS
ncbi:hypothetical protein PGTUg99_026430 [Puccinia graminis f. sp. tritici]|uniref:Uncharacterized protein n=1 Tax=Puccinia graminis f. sp. tritici TaxID=56615 RepID=A0A5B0SKV0_PUCGR|nr:hypothetical protein PGTUg99_026430 [Puccinia graminis f. sp. tritici]